MLSNSFSNNNILLLLHSVSAEQQQQNSKASLLGHCRKTNNPSFPLQNVYHFSIHNRSQSVSVNGQTSRSFDVKHGVRQGSCVGPLLFILYVSKLFTIVERHLPEVHAYADDTQQSTLPSNLSLNMPLMLSQLCKRTLLIYGSDANG